MSPRVALGLQWVITVYALSYFSSYAVNIGLLMPVWLIPLGLAIHRFVVADAGVARIVGGVAGGVLGAAIAHALIEWATSYGLVTGLFFGTLVVGHIATPERRTSAFSLIAGTILLLYALGVLSDLKYFLQPNDHGFVAAAFAIILWFYIAAVSKLAFFKKILGNKSRRRSNPRSKTAA